VDEKQLFSLALGLSAPWAVAAITFDPDRKRLDLQLAFKPGSRFACPECGEGECPVHDTRERTWRHLDFFQHEAYLTAKVPRVRCQEHGVRQVEVPWARSGSGFTLLYEALALCMAKEMPVSAAAGLLRCHADSLWRILAHYVQRAHAEQDLSELSAVGVDECSREKGQQYITTFADLDQSRVIYVADRREIDGFHRFGAHLVGRGVELSQITDLCMDMWQAYRIGADEVFPAASVTFDRFHVMKQVNEAIDAVRRREVKENPALKGSCYLWRKNPEKLSVAEQDRLWRIQELDTKTGRAYQMKLALQRLWTFEDREAAEAYLKRWFFWATHSRLESMIELAWMIRRHWEGILNFIDSRRTTGIVEGLNSKIKTAMKRAYGFKSFRYLRTIIYLVAGKLTLPSPTRC
jgi:transposase